MARSSGTRLRQPAAKRRRKAETIMEDAAPPPLARAIVQLEPAIPLGRIGDRYDFVIRGRAIAQSPVESITLLRGPEETAQITLGHAETGGRLAFADGEQVSQHAFTFHMPVALAAVSDVLAFSVRVRTRDGAEATTEFGARTDPDDQRRGTVVAGPAAAGVWGSAGRPSIVAYVERAAFAPDGTLQVAGWAVADDAIVAVQVYGDDGRIGSATIGGIRADVAAAYPGYPSARTAGFSLFVRDDALTGAGKSVRVHAVSLNGSTYELLVPVEGGAARRAAAPPEPEAAAKAARTAKAAIAEQADPARAITLHCDELALGTDGGVRVRGWVVSPAGITDVTVQLDDTQIGAAERGLARLDVAEAFPGVPDARFSGFELIAKPLDAAEGDHRLVVIARNRLGDTRTFGGTVQADGTVAPAPAPESTTPDEAAAAEARHDPQAFRFHIDNPPLRDGAMVQPVTGRLTIEGWALALEGVAGVEMLLDGRRLGSAHYGLARHDVGTAFPDWPDPLRSGFAFHCPLRSLAGGEHTVTVQVAGADGSTIEDSFRITVARPADSGEYGIRRRLTRAEADLYADILRRLDWQPRFCVLLHPPAPDNETGLEETLAALQAQIYPHWTIEVLADSPALREAVQAAAERAGIEPGRIGFAGAGAAAFAAEADAGAPALIGALACGDTPGCDALAEMAVQSGLHRNAELLYADEIRASEPGGHAEAFFKPGFSPDLLLSTNYIGRPWFATRALLDRASIAPGTVGAMGDYDVLLRCAEHADPANVLAIPRLLNRRGAETKDSALGSAARDAVALEAAALRRGIEAEIEPGCLPGIFRLHRRAAAKGKVSIIVPTRAAQGFIETCLSSLKGRTAYRRTEIVAIDNIPAAMADTKAWLRDNADKVLEIDEPFNWSRFNNRAAAVADGEFLLFLNDDIEVIQEGWLDAMLEHATRAEVGVVGARLLYPGGKVQHAGMFLAGPGLARHAFRFAAVDDPGYFGLARTQRNVIAVTGACMLVRRAVFDALGGFDEAHEVINNDLDFCLRAYEAGLLTVFTPHATLIHHELASRANLADVYDPERFDRRWRLRFAEGDPFHNPNLSRQDDDCRPNDEPAREVTSGHPLFRAQDIRRILAVKVDHIGDFVTALPAIRRLKAHFPQARISVLASRTVRSFTALDPAIDEIIEFDFFHARSALGKRELTPQELVALRDRLAPHRFDLAIDLRKHLDTRELLRSAGAAITAGFDHMGQFNWLDVALEWEGDRGLHAKRYHITDDLIHLVDTVAAAAQADRAGILPDAVAALRRAAALPEALSGFLAGPVVCVHAGAGNEMKQWPEAYFATLIDLLIARDGMRVLLVGGPDESAIAGRVLAEVEHRDQVMSVVGDLPLEALPAVMSQCRMYVGNDSGPKHIAAAVGIPTVGIHSGTVDPVEWAPLGPSAVAIARAMSCSPCYLNRLSDCHRGLACLRELEPQAVHALCEKLLAQPIAPRAKIEPRAPDRLAAPETPRRAAPRPHAKKRTA